MTTNVVSARPIPALLLAALMLLAGCESPPAASSESAETKTTENTAASESADANNDDAEDKEEKIIAIVNGVKIPESRLQVYAQAGAPVDDRQQLIENIIASELMAAAARKQGYDSRPQVREELIVSQQAVLGRAYAGDLLKKNPVDDARIEQRYQELSAEFAGQKEYNVAHILVPEEEQAKDLLEQIKKDKAAFAKLAEEHSQDSGSAANGGVLGWVQPQSLVPAFGDAMQALEVGGITDTPVETTYGWHIIRVDDTRASEPPPLNDELKNRISQVESAELLTKEIEKLRENAEIEIITE